MQQNIYIEVLFHPINLLDRIGNNWREIKVTNHFALSPSFPQEKIVDMKKFSLIAHFPNVKSLAVSVFHFQKSCCLRPPFVLFHFILLFWNHTLTWSVDDIYIWYMVLLYFLHILNRRKCHQILNENFFHKILQSENSIKYRREKTSAKYWREKIELPVSQSDLTPRQSRISWGNM